MGAISGLVSNDDLGGPVEYPPSSANRIIQFCPTLAHVAQSGGDVEEPLWRAMLGVVKYTTEGEAQCHEWSKGYDRYSAAETQDKISRWEKGPTTCDHFRGTNDNKCGDCPHNVTSPIQLGYTEDVAAPEIEFAGTDDAPEKIPYWPKHYRWDGKYIGHAVPDQEGVIQWVPFCTTLFYALKRIRDEDGKWALLCRFVKNDPDKTSGEFSVPMAYFAKPIELNAHMSSYEIFPVGAQGVRHMQEYLRDYTLQLQGLGISQETYDRCGWADNYGSFVLGNRRITPEGVDEILPGEHIVNAGWHQGFGMSGTAEEWSGIVNEVYNRPGAEAYQFVIGGAFAAPLVEIVGVDNWHGIPIGLSGETGLGKTTVCRIACSMYGSGEMFVRSAAKNGSTLMALYNRIGVLRNLPMVIDEATQRDRDEWIDLLYGLSSGRPKDRSTTTGMLANLGLNWNTISFVTSNKPMTEQLIGSEAAVREATEVRLFEVSLSEDMKDLWRDVNFKLVEQTMGGRYGAVGDVWLRYVVEHFTELQKDLHKYRTAIDAKSAEGTKERFFLDLIVCVVVALKHANKLGLIDFDPAKVEKWAKEHVLRLRAKRSEFRQTAEDSIAEFLSSLYGRIIVTKHFRYGRQVVETPIDPIRGAPVARMALEDKVFLVSTSAVDEWCVKNHASPAWFNNELDRRGFITRSNLGASLTKRGAFQTSLARGTNIPSSRSYALELNFEKVFGMLGEDPTNENAEAA